MLNILVADAMEIETLAAREDGLQNLLRVGGAQHKDHVRRRLLKRLEQRVERRRREHVDLVDDINLVLATHRGKVDGVDNFLAHIVHARAGGGIELVNIGVVALGDELAFLTGAVGHAAARTLGARRLGIAAEQRLGKNTRHGGLARAARSAEQVRVGQASSVMACSSVETICCWPTTESKVSGRYFRYNDSMGAPRVY